MRSRAARGAGWVLAGALAATVSAGPAVAAPTPPAGGACMPPPTVVEAAVPWAQRQLAPQRVWPLSTGAGVTVGIVDTGVDGRTPQLSGRVLRGVDLTRPGAGPADSDCFGHGTFIAGIVAAAQVPGVGFAGVAPEARILPVRVANNAADGSVGLLAAGIRAAVDRGASVINVSASTEQPSQPLADAVRYAAEHDVVVVAAAANGAQKGAGVSYPAGLPSVLAVGAVNAAGQRADFSQTGPHLALAAPGVDVVSIGPGGPGQWQGSGTSYAAPFVAGVAALVRAYRPGLSAAQVRRRLELTADHPAATLPDPGVGWGTVNPLAALATVLPEEGASGAPTDPAPAASKPVAARPDGTGAVLTELSVGALVIVVGLVALLSVLVPAGHRRRWRPARTVRVVADRRPPP